MRSGLSRRTQQAVALAPVSSLIQYYVAVMQVAGIKRGAPTSGPLEGPTRFHNHVIYGGTAYIAGQTAADHSVQDYTAQTEQVGATGL